MREIITRYKDDDRVLIWDLYNEPGSGMRDEITKPHIQRFFEIAREVDPIQPVTAGAWCIREVDEPLRWVEQFALDNSDIISYHSYALYSSNVQVIRKLKKYGRPIICTVWLARTLHNTVQEMYPLFYVEKIGCFNWGLVAGKYQTYEPWNTIWEQYDRGQYYNEDFTKWFHDLYRPNHRPYDPFEIELMQTLAKAADKEFQLDHKEKD